jgi:T-complex protein 1 subunit eta
LRGGAEQFIKEAERSLNDAIMIVRRCFKTNKVVAGGGATEMELSRGLKEHAGKVANKEQLVMNMFAKALEIIPRTIADNAGLDSLDIINRLRTRHCKPFLIQTTATRRTSTLELILPKELETTVMPLSGNPFL